MSEPLVDVDRKPTHSPSIREQVGGFGFGVIPGVFPASEVSELTQSICSSSLSRSKAGIRHLLHHAPVAALAGCDRMLSIVRSILGDNALPFRATLFDKSPESNWLVVWHQDTALPLKERRDVAGWGPWSVKDGIIYAHAPATALEQVLAIRVHLDDSTSNNGPLKVLPGTHNLGVLSDDALHQLSEEVSAKECLVECGGVVLMKPLVVHASSKSKSEISRRVLHIEYASRAAVEEGFELALA